MVLEDEKSTSGNWNLIPGYVSGIPVHSFDRKQVLEIIKEGIEHDRAKRHICITNTESMYYAKRVAAHLEFINTSTLSLCDGIGSVIAGKFQGQKITRFNGPDLLLACAEYGQKLGWRHYFCGGKEGVADKLATNLKNKYPEMKVAGTFCPPFRKTSEEENQTMLDNINNSQADIIWVGLGLLKQESWIAQYKEKLNVPWSVGVGAAFDFYAGTAKRAPAVFRKAGFEWLYRLILEPRMFKRNLNSYHFMFSAIRDGITKKYKTNSK
ncbi:WecB/TagA/CpsF family glycosyltransferase [Aquimarina sp. ERC-38]|uniref:WecB/TagA/CpsF family glycosyltransferase n=1 Tax=Aquimarina sp. ERC-38 TaxID=2949996 RepID=UPI0022464E24|nr:WecB/TagA/CpsF family glycosyltransferase [Aquimarina sp. ERC-38]UZO81459.1 WecB/TagA/CpsF family glycosyltransferase [Aquimarina sp. ERC-38]